MKSGERRWGLGAHAPMTIHVRRRIVGTERSFNRPRAAAGGTGPVGSRSAGRKPQATPGVIGGGAPYPSKGRRADLEKFRLRAAYFLRAEKVGKDALRGVRARWVPRLRSAAAVTHRPRPLRTPIAGDST